MKKGIDNMILTNIKCPICGTVFSVGIDKEKKTCTSKNCPKCKTEIEVE
jgi:predicted Zn-ribbon and HTH transcriptional regulator